LNFIADNFIACNILSVMSVPDMAVRLVPDLSAVRLSKTLNTGFAMLGAGKNLQQRNIRAEKQLACTV